MTSVPSWLDDQGHRARLHAGLAAVLGFVAGSALPGGGFAYLGADGRPLPGRRPQLFLTARMGHTAALGAERGIPGSEHLLDHAVESLLGLHADAAHGGFHSEPGTVTRKMSYDHVHVGLAAAGALRVGHPRAATLLERVVDVVETRLWDKSTRSLYESFAPDWSDPEPYRGANANMHGTEAFLALGAVTGEAVWHERALAMAERIVDRAARAHGWLVPEHYGPDWVERPDYNIDDPNHPFRPYGATPGHALEWARFLLGLAASALLPGPPPGWLEEAARRLTERALNAWGADGRPGLVYTVDWSGAPVSRLRLHWPVCEAIQTTGWLVRRTGEERWERWYRRLWGHAWRYFVDERGTWVNELDENLREAGTLWPGRPDVYHCGGALTVGGAL